MAPKGPGTSKRNPTVLVTDSRDRQTRYYPASRTPNTISASDIPIAGPPGSRLITVDNVLHYASDMPSMQQRGQLGQRGPTVGTSSAVRSRSGSGSESRLRSGLNAASNALSSSMDSRHRSGGRLASLPQIPPRSSKVSEKLVLLPETVEEEEDEDEQEPEEEEEDEDDEVADDEGTPSKINERYERLRRLTAARAKQPDFTQDNMAAPLLDDEEAIRKRRFAASPEKGKSYAERLPKARRGKRLPRVTAYCTAQAYKMGAAASFVKELHDARTKLYDDCLYAAYHLPLLPGRDGYRVRSSPIFRSAEGKVVLDEEIARNERRDYHDEYFTETEEHSVRNSEEQERQRSNGRRQEERDTTVRGHSFHVEHRDDQPSIQNGDIRQPTSPVSTRQSRPSIPPNALSFAEMFIFSYGVVVFWNFTERQEKEILADLAFCPAPNDLPLNPLAEEDFETEEFHFEYSSAISRPRVYNDMITLRSGDHMIKLAISHGIAQSTKLSFFEEGMARQMADAKDVPRRLALTGHLGMGREEVFRIMGRLFKSRVEVNLSSNMLDVPNFFWDSEPMLHPLYIAVREYLEIKPRIQVLNERCRVFLDLIEILSDSIADNKVSSQTWIIIILIFISIIVTLSEVVLRFGILSTKKGAQSKMLLDQGKANGMSIGI
ncbi:Sporulation protein RMD8 [Trichophyton interdigitale]|nr:Sporulation protein RMD8 [Trichophyton interdigitale]KAG5218607.1 Sporulation protein RMD8 [Trichophyton interdigitale]KAG8207762.1 Sporulation protein RMD8 [Trichophyton interdigitale]